MPQLASIFDPVKRERGRDLRHAVVLSRGDLGAPRTVEVPLRLPADTGELVERCVGPSDEGERINLNLPADMPLPVTLRLRGLGEVRGGLDAGDLYLDVREGAAQPSHGVSADGRRGLGGADRALLVLGALLLFALSVLVVANVLIG